MAAVVACCDRLGCAEIDEGGLDIGEMDGNVGRACIGCFTSAVLRNTWYAVRCTTRYPPSKYSSPANEKLVGVRLNDMVELSTVNG